MAYINKRNILNAYKALSALSPDPNVQGATQKVSAIRHFLALDAFFSRENRECNTKNREDKDAFANLVGSVCGVCNNLYTTNFYFPLKQHTGDYSVGSNFYSAGQVSASLVNPNGTFDYPKRGNIPLFKIQNGVLIRDVSLYTNLNNYISSVELKVALVVWLIRKTPIDINNGKPIYENIYNSLSNVFTGNLIDVLFDEPVEFESILNAYDLRFNENIYSITENDIRDLFNLKNNESDENLALFDSYQIIFYGAPGTGKSFRVKNFLTKSKVPKQNIFRTTFHPDSDYSTFVGAYKPKMKKYHRYDGKGFATFPLDDDLAKAKAGENIIDKVIEYEFTPQAFLKAYVRAYEVPDEKVYLVIEEINRGNCAQIFGDLFQLLDRDGNGKSDYTIKADDDLKTYLEDEFKRLGVGDEGIKDGELCLPSNLYIFATMNTSDQSLFPIDSAFKRRWDWEYEPIKYKNTNWMIDIDGTLYSWTKFQKEINSRILKDTGSEDKMMGDYFVKPLSNIITKEWFLNKILFYLWNDVCKDGDTDIFPADDFSFSKLYAGNNTNIIKNMMDRLGVEPEESHQSNDEDIDDINNQSSSKDTQYSINGQSKHSKRQLATELIKKYIELNPNLTSDEVIQNWKSLGYFVPHFIESEDEYNKRTDQQPRVNIVTCGSSNIYVSTDGWKGEKVMDDLINAIHSRNWGIRIEKL